MTYKPEEEEDPSPSEDVKLSSDEPNQSVPLDIVPVSNVDAPEPSPPPSTNLFSEDLLVNAAIISFIFFIFFWFQLILSELEIHAQITFIFELI